MGVRVSADFLSSSARLGRATAKNRLSGDWNLFNDERVEGLEPNEVQAASAYVLFYVKASQSLGSQRDRPR